MKREVVAPVTDTVARCVPRQDGAFMVLLRSGTVSVSTVQLPEGARVRIERGRAVRC